MVSNIFVLDIYFFMLLKKEELAEKFHRLIHSMCSKCLSNPCPSIITDDLDVFVLTPGGDPIYYDNKFDPTTEGSLDVDIVPGEDREAEFGTWTENINFSTGPSGIYTVWVNQFDLKGSPDAFTLEIFDDTVSSSVAKYSYSFPAGLAQDVSTPCYYYNKALGTIDFSGGPCEEFIPDR